jgi:5-formyltetrahydrofolate cyclo-ligase
MAEGKSIKDETRDRARAGRDRLTQGEIDTKSRAICRSVQNILDGRDRVMLYASKGQEVNTRPLMEFLLSRGVGVIVPIIEKETRSLRLSGITDLSVLVSSTFSVPEPIGNEVPVREEEIGAVVVPMIAFDRRGHRLGYGAGYYDRFLSVHRDLTKIGLAFSCQEVPVIPEEGNDIAMDLVVTEREIIRCGGPAAEALPDGCHPGGRLK